MRACFHMARMRSSFDYIAWGMTPMEAIMTATNNAADLLGWSDRVGAVAPGLHADIIAVPGDPLEPTPPRASHLRQEGRDRRHAVALPLQPRSHGLQVSAQL